MHAAAPILAQELWADAVQLCADRPDLTLLRARQLVEVLASHAEAELGLPAQGPASTLRGRIERLRDHGLLPSQSVHHLNDTIKAANEAVHMNRVVAPPAQTHAPSARRALTAVATAWAYRFGEPQPPRVSLPAETPAPRRAAFDVELLLDQAELAVSVHRDGNEARALIRQARARAGRARLKGEVLEILEARAEGVELSLRNHAGLPPQPINMERIHRLWERGGPAGRDLALRTLNRQAVAKSNELDLDGARKIIAPHVASLEGHLAAGPSGVGRQPVSDYVLGSMLGTIGMIEAMTSHAFVEPDHLDIATSYFLKARDCFIEDDDRARHETNLLHVLVERHRLGAALTTAQRADLEARVAAAPVTQLIDPSKGPLRWNASAFHVAAAVKACVLCKVRPPWLAALGEALSAVDSGAVLDHPYPQLVGWAMLLDPVAPRRWRQALAATSESPRVSPLIRWICQSFLSPAEPLDPPVEQRAWWETYEIARATRVGPAHWIPFNFA